MSCSFLLEMNPGLSPVSKLCHFLGLHKWLCFYVPTPFTWVVAIFSENCNPKGLAQVLRALVLVAFSLGLRFESPWVQIIPWGWPYRRRRSITQSVWRGRYARVRGFIDRGAGYTKWLNLEGIPHYPKKKEEERKKNFTLRRFWLWFEFSA